MYSMRQTQYWPPMPRRTSGASEDREGRAGSHSWGRGSGVQTGGDFIKRPTVFN